MTYWEFHLVFMLPALVLSGAAARRARLELGRRAIWSVPVLAVLALLWTTPWDNYLVATGVWSYGEDRVAGTIGWVPVEEYVFFVLQPLFTGWLFCSMLMRARPARVSPGPAWRFAGSAVWLGAAMAGGLALRTEPGTYFGLILVWSAPVAAVQWMLGARAIHRYARQIVTAVVASTVYLCIADAIAIRSGIWTIRAATSTGVHLFGLPVEEVAFFLVTNILITQGLLLFLYPPVRPQAT